MKKHVWYVAAFFGLLAGTGCLKDISQEIPDTEPRITVNGFFNPRVPFIVSITESASVLDTLGNKYLTDAKAYIYENNLLVDSLTYSALIHYHWGTGPVPQPGKTYRLEVQAQGFATVAAQSFLPDTTLLLPVVKDTMFYAASGHNTYWLRITFQDPPAAGDFYHLVVYRNRLQHNGTWRLEPLCFESGDPVFETISQQTCSGGLFTDNAFNGQQKEILINTRRRLTPGLNDSLQFIVELRHGSDAYYRYNKSLSIYKNNQGDIFAQPGPIIGNVAGGYGIFAGYAPVTDTVKMN